jgi:hypothetical protein
LHFQLVVTRLHTHYMDQRIYRINVYVFNEVPFQFLPKRIKEMYRHKPDMQS